MTAKRIRDLWSTPKHPDEEAPIWQIFEKTDVMNEYLEIRAAVHVALEKGAESVELPTQLSARLLLDPVNFHDPFVVAAWNYSCEEAGFPDKKKPLPETPSFRPEDMAAGKAFTVGKPLRFKKRAGKSRAGSKEEGAF